MEQTFAPLERLRRFPFWMQATITVSSAVILVAVWSACGGTYTPPPPPPLSSPRLELRARYGDVFALAFSPTGDWLAAGTSDKMARLWDVSKGEVLRTMSGHTGEITSLALSPDGKILASGSADQTVKLWDTSTGKEIRTLSGHAARVTCIAFSPDGHSLASASSDHSVILWDTSSSNQIWKLVGHTDSVSSVAFSPDGRLVASASNDKTARLWDAQSGKLLRTLSGHEHPVTTLAFSPDGKLLATGTVLQFAFAHARPAAIRLWNVKTGAVEYSSGGAYGAIRCLAFRPDGKALAVASEFPGRSFNAEIRLFSTETHELLSLWEAERGGQLYTIAFSPDGRWLASGGHSGRIRLWQ